MPHFPSSDSIDSIRDASRRIVRELGFMGGAFAGTELSPSSVHALIEIDGGNGITASDLGERLHLEKSSISRMLRKLVLSGDIREESGKDDSRSKKLALTRSGRKRVANIHAFARMQVSEALNRLEAKHAQTVIDGLSLYANALAGHLSSPTSSPEDVVSGYRPGLIGRITEMHALYYAHEAGFCRRFETVVAEGLTEFCGRLDRPQNAIWIAVRGERIVGSIAIDGEDFGENVAHLRWFIINDDARGSGLGRKLIRAALGFVDKMSFPETHLWTFSGLGAARHLYEAHGFACVEERPGSQWGKEVLEQRFVRTHP